MRKVILVLAVVAACAVLAGCGKWTKPGATQADYEVDYRACTYEAKKHGYAVNAMEMGFREAQLTNMCMESKGWYMARE
jgi:uncharacterized protein YceK